MIRSTKTFTGVVRGNTIELDGKFDLPDGQAVTLLVRPSKSTKRRAGQGIRKSAGGWDDDVKGLDQFLKWSRKQRKNGRAELEP
jgi:hypothetical protein